MTSHFADLITTSESVGAALENRRIRHLIERLPPAGDREWLYRMRVLNAIVMTPQRESEATSVLGGGKSGSLSDATANSLGRQQATEV